MSGAVNPWVWLVGTLLAALITAVVRLIAERAQRPKKRIDLIPTLLGGAALQVVENLRQKLEIKVDGTAVTSLRQSTLTVHNSGLDVVRDLKIDWTLRGAKGVASVGAGDGKQSLLVVDAIAVKEDAVDLILTFEFINPSETIEVDLFAFETIKEQTVSCRRQPELEWRLRTREQYRNQRMTVGQHLLRYFGAALGWAFFIFMVLLVYFSLFVSDTWERDWQQLTDDLSRFFAWVLSLVGL